MRKIAVEEHVCIRSLEELADDHLSRIGFPSIHEPERLQNTLGPLMYLEPETHRLPLMDKYGVDVQVLSVGSVGIQNDLDAARATENARMANDYVHAMVQKHPGRFAGFGTLAMQDVDAAVEELTRCVTELGFRGILMNGATNFTYYDEPRYDPVWAKLEALDVPLFLHVSSPEADQIRMYGGYPELLGNTWNWGVVGATHALRIIFGGVFDRYPRAQLILGHMGESLPYLMGRLDEGYDCRNVRAKGRMANPPSHYLRNNIYITTSGGFYPEAMACALLGMGPERILFANDYPHYPLEKTVAHMAACDLTPAQQALIYHKNAERLFGL